MPTLLSLIPLAAPLALVAAALLSRRYPGARPRPVEQAVGVAGVLGVVSALGTAALVVANGPIASGLLGAAGLGLSLYVDALSAAMFTMVAIIALVVLRFSRTYLQGDPRHGVFLGRMAFAIAAVELLVLAGNLALFVGAWVLTSAALHRLLLFYPERPRARIAARKKFIVARLGEVALIGAASVIYVQVGTGQLDAIFAELTAFEATTGLAIAALLLAVAALFKSAQFPTHGWLVEVMETPTPVSALLHAGILNAGPYLVIRFATVMEFGLADTVLLVVVGGFTALFASTVLLTQNSVKVALGYSSAAHMGFSLLVCGLGVYSAAFLHLVAHSFYKAHAFLSSGSAVERGRIARGMHAERRHSAAHIGAGAVLALAIYAAIAWAIGFDPTHHPELAAVGAVVVLGLAHLLGTAVDSARSGATVAATAGLAALVTLAFFGFEAGAHALLDSSLPDVHAPNPAVTGLAVGALLFFAVAVFVQLALTSSDSRWARALYVHARNGFYANAVFDRMVGALRRA